MGTDREREADFQRFLHPLGDRAVEAPPAPTEAEDALQRSYPIGHSGTERSAFMRGWQARGLAFIRASEQAAPPLDVPALVAEAQGWASEQAVPPLDLLRRWLSDEVGPDYLTEAEHAQLVAETRAALEALASAQPVPPLDVERQNEIQRRHGVAILMHQRQCVGDDGKTPTEHALADCPHRDLILGAAQSILDVEYARLGSAPSRSTEEQNDE